MSLDVRGLAYRVLQHRAPRVYVRVIRLRGADFYPVTRDADLVVAGAPGSANSWLRAAFLEDNPDAYVASHAHVWTEVRDAVRWGRPTVLLVRDPVGEVCSRLTRFGNLTPAQALEDYAHYHHKARRWADRVVVATFEQATESPGAVVRRVNARYGTAFAAFPDDPQRHEQLHARLRAANGAVPSGDRAAAQAAARAALAAPALAGLRAQCEELYAGLTADLTRHLREPQDAPSSTASPAPPVSSGSDEPAPLG